MQNLSNDLASRTSSVVLDVEDDRKELLVDRRAIYDSVAYLLDHGFSRDEVQRCLVRYFYVDLDLLNEALTAH